MNEIILQAKSITGVCCDGCFFKKIMRCTWDIRQEFPCQKKHRTDGREIVWEVVERRESRWRPIETAPKQGDISVTLGRAGVWVVPHCSWLQDKEIGVFVDEHGEEVEGATHWMPDMVPPPPVVTEA